MAYPLAEQYEHGKEKLKPTGKPLFTPEKEQFIKEVQEVVKTKPAQAVLQSSPIKALGGALRYVGYVSERVTGYYKDRAVDRPVSLEGMIGLGLYGLEGLDKGVRAGARALNVDEDVASFGKDVVIDAVTGKLAPKVLSAATKIPPTPPTPKPQLAYAVAGAAPMPPMTVAPSFERGGLVMKSTTSPPWTSPKAGLGSAESKLFAPAVKRWEKRESLWQEALENLRQSGASVDRIKKFEAVRKGDLSTFDYDPENLYEFFDGLRESPYFKQTRQRGELKALEAARPLDPYDLAKKAQQHHILAKAETKPFVETLMRLMADNIANKDDLVNFFVWSEKYDLIPGNVRKNLLHMGEVTHTVAKKDPMALHNLLKEAGLEYGSRTGPEMVKRYGLDKVTSADELMQAYDKYLQEIAIPSRDITYKVHDWWYDKTVKTLKGKELAEFKANYSKLSDPRKMK